MLTVLSTLFGEIHWQINVLLTTVNTPWVKKGRHYTLVHIFAKYWNSFTDVLSWKFAIKLLIKIPRHLRCVEYVGERIVKNRWIFSKDMDKSIVPPFLIHGVVWLALMAWTAVSREGATQWICDDLTQVLWSSSADVLAGDHCQRSSCVVSIKLQRGQRWKRRLQTALQTR